MLPASRLIGECDVLFVTLDTLRFDVADAAYREGRTPHLASVLPRTGWERRHSPGNFTFAAHAAFFAGFLPTPASPGVHPRLMALRFPGSETTVSDTAVLEGPDIVAGLRERGYPHKTAYRPLRPTPLAELWAHETVDSLSLYVHVPFCTMRCGFCNLFTTPNPNRSFVSLYLEGLRRQAEQVKAAIPAARFSRFAIGGGTPTFLDARELAALFDLVTETFGVDSSQVPTGIEVSPDTISSEKVRILLDRGVERFSIGIQSFVEAETSSSGLPDCAPRIGFPSEDFFRPEPLTEFASTGGRICPSRCFDFHPAIDTGERP